MNGTSSACVFPSWKKKPPRSSKCWNMHYWPPITLTFRRFNLLSTISAFNKHVCQYEQLPLSRSSIGKQTDHVYRGTLRTRHDTPPSGSGRIYFLISHTEIDIDFDTHIDTNISTSKPDITFTHFIPHKSLRCCRNKRIQLFNCANGQVEESFRDEKAVL